MLKLPLCLALLTALVCAQAEGPRRERSIEELREQARRLEQQIQELERRAPPREERTAPEGRGVRVREVPAEDSEKRPAHRREGDRPARDEALKARKARREGAEPREEEKKQRIGERRQKQGGQPRHEGPRGEKQPRENGVRPGDAPRPRGRDVRPEESGETPKPNRRTGG